MWPDEQSKDNLSESDGSGEKSQASICDSVKNPPKQDLSPHHHHQQQQQQQQQDQKTQQINKSVSSPHVASGVHGLTKGRSASRDSSLNDDRKSTIDSISAVSEKQNWCMKEVTEDDPSVSSIKGDSISATIANYNRRHKLQTVDSQSRASAKMDPGDEPSSSRNDDLSTNVNFYAASGSLTGMILVQASSSRTADFASISSNVNNDSFDVIEESSNISSGDDLASCTDAIANKSYCKKQTSSSNKSKQHQSKQRYRKVSSRQRNFYQTLEVDDLPQGLAEYQVEPIILRGNGNLTLFGLSNSFSSDFPSALIGRVSKEEFNHTIRKVNSLLRDQQSLSAKLLLFGGLCCCCSLGLSLVWPSIALRRKSKTSIEKFLAGENSRLYSKLGLNWKLSEQRCFSNHAFVEYVLMIEFTPKIDYLDSLHLWYAVLGDSTERAVFPPDTLSCAVSAICLQIRKSISKRTQKTNLVYVPIDELFSNQTTQDHLLK